MSTDIFDKDLIKIPLKISVRKTIQRLTPLLEDGIVEKEVWGGGKMLICRKYFSLPRHPHLMTEMF